jgi:hypothetical protein
MVKKAKMKKTGLVLAGKRVLMPGFNITNFLDNPHLHLASGDVRRRSPWEQEGIHLIVMHTTGGIPGGKDLRPQVIIPGTGLSSNAGERIVSSWSLDTDRPGGAALIIDFDCEIYCCTDLILEAAYHAKAANGCSVGIEIVQGKNAELYSKQLATAAKFTVALCKILPTPIQLQIPLPYQAKPIKRFVDSQKTNRPLFDVVGIVGHRDLTSSRGEGDPGDAIMKALSDRGCQSMDFEARGDITIWKERQFFLGMTMCDGIPGKETVKALKIRGCKDGLWVNGNAK